jgi:Transcription termination factor nusG
MNKLEFCNGTLEDGNTAPARQRCGRQLMTSTAGKWYVARTHAHEEAKAIEHLRRQGFATYLPRYRKERRHAGAPRSSPPRSLPAIASSPSTWRHSAGRQSGPHSESITWSAAKNFPRIIKNESHHPENT